MTAARSKGHSGAVAPGDLAQQGQTAGLHGAEGPGGLPGAMQSPGCVGGQRADLWTEPGLAQLETGIFDPPFFMVVSWS